MNDKPKHRYKKPKVLYEKKNGNFAGYDPENPKYPKKPNKAQIRKIKLSLGLPLTAKLPRCPSIAKAKVKRFEYEEDFTHSDKDHICSKCKCSHIAGYGTDHYGVGYCVHHEKRFSSEHNQKVAKVMKEAMHNGYPEKVTEIDYPMSKSANALDAINRDAEQSEQSISVRTEFNMLRESLHDYYDMLKNGKDQETPILEALTALADAIKDAEFVEPDQGEEILKSLDSRIFESTDLTETSSGKLMRMSDKSKLTLLANLAKSMSGIAKDEFSITSDDYVHVDEVKIWVRKVVLLSQKMLPEKEDFEKWFNEFRTIPTPSTGRK